MSRKRITLQTDTFDFFECSVLKDAALIVWLRNDIISKARQK